MKKLIALALLAMAPTVFAGSVDTHVLKDGFALIHVAELDSWMKTDAANVHVFDANNEETRKDNGIIENAVTLPSSSHYTKADLKDVPLDSKVVFYCANTSCMASHDAAKVAVKMGYKHVYVMADGIKGWVDAKKPVTKKS